MKTYDIKHIAYHVLVGLYFIWLPVFSILLGMALHTTFIAGNLPLARIFLVWIFLNLIMGSALFIVIRLFSYRSRTGRVVLFTFVAMAAICLATTLLIAGQP